MKDNDSKLIGEAYEQIQEGIMGAMGGAADTAELAAMAGYPIHRLVPRPRWSI